MLALCWALYDPRYCAVVLKMAVRMAGTFTTNCSGVWLVRHGATFGDEGGVCGHYNGARAVRQMREVVSMSLAFRQSVMADGWRSVQELRVTTYSFI